MILVGSQRGGARDLARHLLKDENDHVTIHELRGFASENLMDALTEVYALSRGTRCKQYLYSLSLNPPETEKVGIAHFEDAIERAEERLGLEGQPRAVVFHEKEGRRHAHVVWSRIDGMAMKAVQLPFTKQALNDLGRELFLEHGWKMPQGFTDPSLRDPKNFTLAEWQQAKRQGNDPREIKLALQDAWAISDNRTAFEHALKERGFALCRGDRRGFIALDWRGVSYAIPRWVGVKTKDVRDRLGDEQELRSLAEAKRTLAENMSPKVRAWRQEALQRRREDQAAFAAKRDTLVAEQRKERHDLAKQQRARAEEEAVLRQSRFRRGLGGLWDRLRGKHGRIKACNLEDASKAKARDLSEREDLVLTQRRQRRQLASLHHRDRAVARQLSRELSHEARHYRELSHTEEASRRQQSRTRDGPEYER